MTVIAAIARDSNGKILDGINVLVRTKCVQVPEALALRLGSVLAKRWQWESIILESDNMGLIHSVKNKSFNCWGSLAIEQDIVSLLNSVSACLSFIPYGLLIKQWIGLVNVLEKEFAL